jgi:hypothetical protein
MLSEDRGNKSKADNSKSGQDNQDLGGLGMPPAPQDPHTAPSSPPTTQEDLAGAGVGGSQQAIIEWLKEQVKDQIESALSRGPSPSSLPSREEQGKEEHQSTWVSGLAALKGKPNHQSQLPTHNAAAAGFVWERAQLEPGCPVQKIADEFIRACEITGADSAVVIYKGKVVATRDQPGDQLENMRDVYVAPWCPARSQLASSSKSIGALALFCFLDDKFRGEGLSGEKLTKKLNEFLDKPIVEHVNWPEWNKDDNAQKITLRHVLTHTSGLPGNEFFKPHEPNGITGDHQFGGYNDINEAIRKLDLVENQPTKVPGKVYDYSNPGAQVAAAVLSDLLKQQCPSQTLETYVKERIFDKLGMTETDLDIFQSGEPRLYGGIQSTALDFARIGLMILNGGSWDGSQFISEDAMQAMLSCPDVVKNLGSDQAHLWWLPKDLQYSDSHPRCYAAFGFRHSNMHIFPDHHLIFVRLQTYDFNEAALNDKLAGLNIGFKHFGYLPVELVRVHLDATRSKSE